MDNKQKTVVKPVIFDGVGVHTGSQVRVIVHPASAGAGITLKRGGSPAVSVKIGTVIPENAMYATVIRVGSWTVSTIEHLMAALAALGIDNAVLEVFGDECPILDGSSLPFINKLLEVGLKSQGDRKSYLAPREQLTFVDEKDNRCLELTPPSDEECARGELCVNYSASFNHPLLKEGHLSYHRSGNTFARDIAPARTFGFLEQLPLMRKMGLAKGASLENTVVIGKDGFINKRRFEDECIRHKLLDLIGDLALLGASLIGSVKASRTGHSFNRRVIEHYIAHPTAWRLI